MSDTSVETLTKMLEALPESSQERVIEHLREYIEDLRDEAEWDERFRSSRAGLADAARKARRQIEEGLAEPMDAESL
jgi:hypothetical protein